MMKLIDVTMHAIRNAYEYEQFMPELYRKDHPEEKYDHPMLVLEPVLVESDKDEAKDVIITLTPKAEVSLLNSDEVVKKEGNDKIKVNFNEASHYIIIDTVKELGYTTYPSAIKLEAKTITGDIITSSLNIVSIEDKETTLENIKEQFIEGSGNLQLLGQYLYQIVDKLIK